MRFLAAAFATVMLSLPAQAQKADDHLRVCMGSAFCESSRAQFRSEYPRAYRRDYGSQRNVSFCLVTGCDGAVQQNRALGCAWRLVITAGMGAELRRIVGPHHTPIAAWPSGMMIAAITTDSAETLAKKISEAFRLQWRVIVVEAGEQMAAEGLDLQSHRTAAEYQRLRAKFEWRKPS